MCDSRGTNVNTEQVCTQAYASDWPSTYPRLATKILREVDFNYKEVTEAGDTNRAGLWLLEKAQAERKLQENKVLELLIILKEPTFTEWMTAVPTPSHNVINHTDQRQGNYNFHSTKLECTVNEDAQNYWKNGPTRTYRASYVDNMNNSTRRATTCSWYRL
eukprot:2532660-Amphidinium_carterae.1